MTETIIRRKNTTDVNVAKGNNETWSFSYYMDGIGNVTAASTSVSYYAPLPPLMMPNTIGGFGATIIRETIKFIIKLPILSHPLNRAQELWALL